MSKGGGGTQVVQQDGLPEYAEPYLKRILATGEKEIIRPYEEYTGQTIADESPERIQVNEAIRALADAGAPYFGEAMDTTRGVIRQLGEAQEFTGENIEKYMSPFLDQVLQGQKDAAVSDYLAQRGRRASDAVAAGAFGGGREALIESQAEANLLNRLSDIEAKGRQAAFESATGLFDKDRSAREQRLLNQVATAAGLTALGEGSQESLLERLRQLEGVGKAEEAREQAGLDAAYEEFLREQGFPTEQLERFSALIRGIPLPSQRTTETLTRADPLSTLAGLGITGIQLANMV
tara:strand:- start:709 stop:1587 length:879 start_codon:yes stop_codon:yes gene_type:complete